MTTQEQLQAEYKAARLARQVAEENCRAVYAKSTGPKDPRNAAALAAHSAAKVAEVAAKAKLAAAVQS